MNMKQTFGVLGLLLLLGANRVGAQPVLPSSLEAKVYRFLRTDKDAEAETLLKEIQNDPAATVKTVEEILSRGTSFSREKSGDQVHLPVSVDGEEMSYGLYVPKSYDPTKRYPLVVCLHGMGFNGDSYLERWEGRLGEDYILACPTQEEGAWWTLQGEALVLAVLRDVAMRYPIDSNRIFLTGMSNGGIGTYLIGLHHADRFAAIAPMASGIPKEIFPFLENFKDTPVYIIHGAKDQVMPVALSREIYAYFEKLGYPVIYREHDLNHPMAGGHFFPKEELPRLVDWLAKQRRNPYPKEVLSIRDIDHLDRFYWTKINQLTSEIASVADSVTDREEAGRVKRGEFARLYAKISGNTITVDTDRVARFTLYLNPKLVDFRKPVSVIANGEKRFEGKIEPDLAVLLKEARSRHDPAMLFEAQVSIDVPVAPGDSAGAPKNPG